MSSRFRIRKAEITGVYGRVLTAYCKRTFGQVPDNLYVFWHNRKVLNSVLRFEQKVTKYDALDPHLKIYAELATAGAIGCSWCLDFGYFLAQSDGLQLEKVREVPRWRESEVFTELERDVMEYAEAMSQTPLTVTDELSDRLLEALGAPALVELNAFIALANLYTRMNVALGVEAHGLAASCDLAPLPEPSSAIPSPA
jgi:alkylhydroperoxidase family enzyme